MFGFSVSSNNWFVKRRFYCSQKLIRGDTSLNSGDVSIKLCAHYRGNREVNQSTAGGSFPSNWYHPAGNSITKKVWTLLNLSSKY